MRRSLRVALLALAASTGACSGAEPPPVENAVLICLDTVRFDTLAMAHAAAGDDAAARRWNAGTRLVRTQSTAPWTLPAVASVFTGLHPNEHRAGTFRDRIANITKRFPLPLAAGRPTLPGILAYRGFETVGFVAHSWFRRPFGLQRGFALLDLDLHTADEVVGRTEAWLEERSGRLGLPPFFLYLHFMEAHRPMHLGPEDLAPQLERLSPELKTLALSASPRVCAERLSIECLRYLGYVEAVATLRRAVGEVLDLLDARGLLERTVVIAFSDHGEEFLDHVEEGAARALDPRGTYGFGHGHTLYQEQLHVPLVIWHPEVDPGEVAMPASLVDVTPTLLGWLGIEPDWQMTGTDLGPLLAGEVAPDPQRPLFSSSVAFGPERAAVVRGERKRIGDGGSGAGPLVFDLVEDPREREPSPPGAADDLAGLLADYVGQRAPGGAPADPSPEVIEELQALGYLEEADAE